MITGKLALKDAAIVLILISSLLNFSQLKFETYDEGKINDSPGRIFLKKSQNF